MPYLALLVAVLVVPAASAQTTRYVDPSGTDSGDCAAPAGPSRTVAYALAQAVDGDALHLAAGIYNPFNPRTAFSLTLAEAEAVTVTLVDALGREVARLHDGPLAAGAEHRFEVDGARLASGVYVVAVEGEAFRDRIRLTLVR